MEEKDEIEKKFSETFHNFSKEPPPKVWEHISRALNPEPKPITNWERVVLFPRNSPRLFRVGITVAASLLIFLSVVYFGAESRHVVSGHVYAGDGRLCRGTAYLFIVNDKTQPYDSLEHFRSAVVNEKGFYRFPGVVAGRYLIRIAPVEGSENVTKYQASWFDQHESPDSAHLVNVAGADVDADIYLVRKR